MAGKDILAMSTTELKRVPVIQKTINRELKQKDAADILDLCIRQIQRLIRRVKQEGDKGLIHRSRGKPSNRARSDKIKNKILHLCKTRYKGFNPTFAAEKLFEIDELIINPETLRLWFIKSNIDYKRRKHKKHRQWRERRHHFGQMIQVDGSHHAWFEQRAPKCVLLGYIDDATNTVFSRFYKYEGSFPFMDSFKRYIKKYGMPYSIYIDKHTTYKSTGKPSIEDELNNTEPLSQVARALKELGVEVIYANSAQAKGRIERLFQTFQDRLIKEMRLRKIKSIDTANNFLRYYLPVFNKRFNIKPIEDVNLHRSLPEDIDLNSILCLKTERSLRNDFTIAHNKKLYQILDHINTKRVLIQERINGVLLITYKDKPLRYKQIDKKAIKLKPKTPCRPKIKKPHYIPTTDHPYRRFRAVTPKYMEAYIKRETLNQKQKQELLLTKT